jgi:hypothetical protein
MKRFSNFASARAKLGSARYAPLRLFDLAKAVHKARRGDLRGERKKG